MLLLKKIVSEKIKKKQIYKVYTGKLTYSPESCEHCKNHSTINRWGMTTVRLLLNEVAEFKTYL